MQTPGVLETTLPVVQAARQVVLRRDRIDELADDWATRPFDVPPWDEEVHWSDGGPRTANYVLLLDALNFCFWPDPGQVRWEIDYRGRRPGGYRALAASLKRAVEEGVPILDAEWLARVDEGLLRGVFRGQGEIPMLDRRVAHAREVGAALRPWGGSFAAAVESVSGSAVELVRLLERDFPSFRDVALYGGREVRFLKRAQITVVDLHGTFSGTRWGKFRDLDALTAFADYKIPQVLRALGVLEYREPLAARVDRLELLPAGSPEEVEIRAAMVWALEELRLALVARGVACRSFELDWLFWNLGQAPLPEERPYHRTRTWFY